MAKVTHLPHVKNVKSGMNKWDPNHAAIFEVYFTLPPSLQGEYKEDEALLTEQVVSVAGLDALQKTVQAGSQKFFGVDVSYLNPTLDNTYAEFTIVFNLNLRNVTDNFVLNVFKSWEKLGYNLLDGTRTLENQYISDVCRIAEANRDGTIWRSFTFHRCMIIEVSGLDTLEYTNNEARKLTVKWRADYWDEELASGSDSVSENGE